MPGTQGLFGFSDQPLQFIPHQPGDPLCPCEICFRARLAFQKWRYDTGRLTEDLTDGEGEETTA